MNAWRWTAAVVLVLVAAWGGRPASAQTPQEIEKQAAKANQKATHKELAAIKLKGEEQFEQLRALCVNADGNLLACDTAKSVIRVISPEGKLVATWKPEMMPEAVAALPDGTVFAAGEGKLAKLDKAGAVVKKVDIGGKMTSALAASEKDVFASVWADTGFTVVRFNHELGGRKKIVDSLRGCCGTLDLATYQGDVYVAENARHQVVRYDRDGKVVAKWGQSDGTKIEAFASCCNPMNLCVTPTGEVITAESGPDRVKRYSGDGKYLGLVGWFAGGKSCRCVDIALSPDGQRVYVGDSTSNTIRVLASKGAVAAGGPGQARADDGPK